jgi:hypothetical protein
MPADYLSRNVVEAIRVSDEDLANHQNNDPLCKTIRCILKNEPIQQIFKRKFLTPAEKLALTCFIKQDLLWTRIIKNKQTRMVLVVPESMVNALLTGIQGDMLYEHEEQTKTKERILQSYWWRGMNQDINEFLEKCDKCQKTKKFKHSTENQLIPLLQCSEPNQRIHMDLFGPLKTSESGKKFIMCITDAFSKFAELIAIPDKCAETVANTLFTRRLCRHSLPLETVSDQG